MSYTKHAFYGVCALLMMMGCDDEGDDSPLGGAMANGGAETGGVVGDGGGMALGGVMANGGVMEMGGAMEMGGMMEMGGATPIGIPPPDCAALCAAVDDLCGDAVPPTFDLEGCPTSCPTWGGFDDSRQLLCFADTLLEAGACDADAIRACMDEILPCVTADECIIPIPEAEGFECGAVCETGVCIGACGFVGDPSP